MANIIKRKMEQAFDTCQGWGPEELMPLHGLEPGPWQECKLMPATIGVCHAQQANHNHTL